MVGVSLMDELVTAHEHFTLLLLLLLTVTCSSLAVLLAAEGWAIFGCWTERTRLQSGLLTMPSQRNLLENKDAVATNDKVLSGLELLMDVIPILVEEYKKLYYSSLLTFWIRVIFVRNEVKACFEIFFLPRIITLWRMSLLPETDPPLISTIIHSC